MLSERCVVTLLKHMRTPANVSVKDVGIYVDELVPVLGVKQVLKKSSVKVNCVAVNASLIFAAQADRAVIHIYNIEKGSQEAMIPLQESPTSLAFVGEPEAPGTLAIGTESGRLLLWELCTGRQVSTSPSHLEAIKCLAADKSSNFIISGSDDSNLHVWSLAALLSFVSVETNVRVSGLEALPLRRFSDHHAPISALCVGSGGGASSFAISGSRDGTCIIWDYMTGDSLRTYLLPSAALTLIVDPVDRVFYAGYDDGSIHSVGILYPQGVPRILAESETSAAPVQLRSKDRWRSPEVSNQRTVALGVSFDGTLLVSGHEDGKIHVWDVAKRARVRCAFDHQAPISNIVMLPPEGFPSKSADSDKTATIQRPKIGGTFGVTNDIPQERMIPKDYSLTRHFDHDLEVPRLSGVCNEKQLLVEFDAYLHHPAYPTSLLREGLNDFAKSSSERDRSWSDRSPDSNGNSEEFQQLHRHLGASRKLYRHTAEQVQSLKNELHWFQRREKFREEAKKTRRLRRLEEADVMRRLALGDISDDVSTGKVMERFKNGRGESSDTSDEMSERK